MPRVTANSADLRPKPIPAGFVEADLIRIDHDFVAPWDDENRGMQWVFAIVEEGDFKGRRLSQFTTLTPGKPASTQYERFCKGVGVTDPDDWDTDDFVGMPVIVEVTTYEDKKGETRNSIGSVNKR